MYHNKKVIHIVATGLNGEIGFDNKLLWHIPEDLRFFKETTLGHVVLMGRKTVESLPKPLERRITIPLGRCKHGYETLDDALGACLEYSNKLKTNCIYIAGGASIYEATKNIVDEVLLTKVYSTFNHADTFYTLPDDFISDTSSLHSQYKDLVFNFNRFIKK